MRLLKCLFVRLFALATICLLIVATARPQAPGEASLTKDQIKQFLLTANVIASKESKKGVTHTTRLTLSNGTTTHDASFQSIDEHKPEES